MRKLLLAGLVACGLGPTLLAAWAAHLVISPASKAAKADDRFAREAAELARAVSVTPISKAQVLVTIKEPTDEGPSGKGYFLVVCKKRLAADALELRSVLSGWKHANERRIPAVAAALEQRGLEDPIAAKGVTEVRPLSVVTRGGERRVEVVLDRAHALRSYIVWDFRVFYEKTAAVMDGGLWVTYDVPAFVEAAAAKPFPAERK